MPFISALKESFATAPIQDREHVVKKLATPNTDEARYYEGLVLLQKIYDEIMKQATPEIPRAATTTETELAASMAQLLSKFNTKTKHFDELNTRFHLLIFPFDTSTSIEFIRKELGLNPLTAERIDSTLQGQTPTDSSLSTSTQLSELDPRTIDGVELITRKCKQATPNDYLDLEPFAFPYLHSVWDTLTNEQQVLLMMRILQSYPASDQLLGKELLNRLVKLWKLQLETPSFSNWKLEELPFYNLSLQQMDHLVQEIPHIVFLHKSFITAYLEKLVPVEFDNIHAKLSFWDDQDGILKNYLERLSSFVDKLPSMYAQLKLAVRFHTLRLHIVRRDLKEESLLSFLTIMSPTSASVSPVPSRNLFGNSTVGNPFNSNHTVDESDSIAIPLLGSSSVSDFERKQVIREYLTGLVEENKLTVSIETLGSSCGDYHDFLKPFYAELMLTLRNVPDNSAQHYINVLGQQRYEALVNKSYVSFAPCTLYASVRRKPSDTIALQVRSKNIPRLSLRVYQIETEDYWRLHMNDETDELTRSRKINLDGLRPTFETDFNTAASPIEARTSAFEFGHPNGSVPEVFKGRGMWVVEFVGGQHQCRSIVQKGYIRKMVQSTAAGHLFKLIDEENNAIHDAKIWYNNQYYDADKESGDILIPYLPSDQNAKTGKIILISCADGFCEPASFYHLTEQYELSARFYLNYEMIYSNKKAKVVVVPDLRVNGVPLSLDLLEDEPTLTVNCTNINGVKNSMNCQQSDFELNCLAFDFIVPDQLSHLEFSLKGKIKTLNGKLQDLRAEHQKQFNSTFKQSGLPGSFHLQKLADGTYKLHVLGKNGEGKKNYEVSLQLKHTFANEPINVCLKTDASATIKLGKLKDIHYLNCSSSQGLFKEWVLADEAKQELPVDICVPANTGFKLPCPTFYPASLYSLHKTGTQQLLLNNLSDCIKKGQGYLEIDGLPEGNYIFYVPSTAAGINAVRCTVIQPSVSFSNLWSKWLLNDTIYAQQSVVAKAPLNIQSTNINNESIEIQLQHYMPHSYAIVTATTFVPSITEQWITHLTFGVPQSAMQHSANDTSNANTVTTRAIFLDDQRISEEYQYILNRSRAEKWVGNNLSKPSLLMYPKKNADTVTMERYLDKGRVLHKRMAQDATPRSARYCLQSSPENIMLCGMETASLYSSCDNSLAFLDYQSPMMIVPVNPETGTLSISRNAFGSDVRLLQVTVISNEQSLHRQVVLPGLDASIECKDLRQPSGSNKPLVRSKVITNLMPSQNCVLHTNEYEVLDSFEKLFDIIKSISTVGNHFVDEFYFLRNWPSLTDDEKLLMHEKHVCHEFNLWLKKKDPQFFEKCVKPALKSKVRKSFFDRYLVDENLSEYCQSMHRIHQLSVVEKALLASSSGSKSFCSSILRLFKDAMDNQQFEERADAIFDSILAHGGSKSGALLHNESDKDEDDAVIETSFTGASNTTSSIQNVVSYGLGAASQPPPPPQAAPFARALFGQAPRSAKMASAGPAPSQASQPVMIEEENEDEDEEAKQTALMLREKAKEQQKKVSYKYIKPTAEYKETGFYDDASKANIVKQFWVDYLEYHTQDESAQSKPFLSKSFMYALNNVAEIFYVLSLMDLPFAFETDWKTEAVETEDENGHKVSAVSITAHKYPAMVFYRSLVETPNSIMENNPTLMIGQEFFIAEENAPIDSNECVKVNPQQTSLEPLVEYGNHLIISNASSKPITCQITVQVPTGSVPTQTSEYCKSKTVSIDAYSTWHEVLSTFYFPATGSYAIPPVTVSSSSGDEVLGMVKAIDVEVKSPQISEESDTTTKNMSWSSLAVHGSPSSILSFLGSYSNLAKLDLTLIQWRMRDKEFARQVIDTLKGRYVFNRDIWQYGLLHQFTDVLREFLFFHSSSLLQKTGYIFDSPLINNTTALESAADDSEEDNQTVLGNLDYYPMLHARVHPLKTTSHEILNKQFYTQYNKFLDYMSQKTTSPSASDLLTLTLYLLLQDRVGEAHNVYARIAADQAEKDVKVQFDYLGAYLKTCVPTTTDMQMLDLQSVKDTAQHYMKEFGVLQWRQRFADLYHFVCEVEQGYVAVSSEANERVRSEEPILELEIDERQRQLLIQYNAHVKSVQIKYYEMDIEVMFSNHPFMAQGSAERTTGNSFQWIKPSKCTVIDLPDEQQHHAADGNQSDSNEEEIFDMIGVGQINSLRTLKVPIEGGNNNVFIEISSGSLKRRRVYYANNIYAHISEAFGVVRVMNKETKRPMMGAYVKVYARLKDSKQVHFWKDGYTSLNGVFDYVSVTEGNMLIGGSDLKSLMLEKVDKLSILVSTTEDGAVVKEVYPPFNG